MDKGALNGLRGFFALHVMLFHACRRMPIPDVNRVRLDLFAEVDMPLFFILSGFTLTIAYGKTSWSGSTRCCFVWKSTSSDGVNELEEGETKVFDSWEFYIKRMIRILPIYYVCLIADVVVWTFG